MGVRRIVLEGGGEAPERTGGREWEIESRGGWEEGEWNVKRDRGEGGG